jgi:DNA-directed RNA polymerase beta subunit
MKLNPILTDASVKREQIRNRVVESLRDVFPIEGRKFTVDVKDVKVHEADFSTDDHKRALLQARTLAEPIRGTLLLKNKSGKVVQKIPNFNLLQLPYFTPHHTFVIGGNSYTVSNQLRMKPGIYTRKRRNEDLEAQFNLGKGNNFRLSMDPSKGVFNIEYGTTKIPLYPILRQLGISDKDITKNWSNDLIEINRAAAGSDDNKYVEKLYNRLVRPYMRTAKTLSDRVAAVKEAYKETQLDPKITEKTLNKRFDKVTPDALLTASNKLLRAHREDVDFDERDSLEFKRMLSVDDFLGERVKLEARGIRRKLVDRLDRATGNPDLERVLSRSPFSKTVHRFLSTSALANNPDQINPVEILDQAVRITSLGEGGIEDERAIPREARNLHATHMGVLDPVRTPETSRAGIDLRTAIFALRDKKGNIYTQMRDKNGRVRAVPVDVYANSVVAFPKQELKGKVDVFRNYGVESVPASQVDYQIPNPQAMYSPSTNLIPFIESTDGLRATMASKMNTQALPLNNPEAPFVQVKSHLSNESMESVIGDMIAVRAPVSGKVSAIRNGYIYIRPKSKIAASDPVRIRYEENFPLASKTYLHHELRIKRGDTVKAGELLADSIFTKDGILALGKNLLTAYMPLHGLNSNDAVVVSEGAAKKLTSRHMYREALDIDPDVSVGRNVHKTYFGGQYTKNMYENLDNTGLIKPGTVVQPGDLLIAAVRKSTVSPESAMLGKLHKSLVKPYRDTGLTWEHSNPGKVIDVSRVGNKIRLTVKTEEPLQVGDKLSGRYGNKGVVSKIIPDDQMVTDEKGRVVDLIVSSASVVSRINPSQVLETALAKVADKTGKPVIVESFSGNNNVEWVKKQLKKHGLKDIETVTDPTTGKKIKGVLVGPQYTYKLFKSTETNFSARGVEDYDSNLQPSQGGAHGAKGLGRMEINALIAHDARNILRDAATLKSQRNDEFWRAIQLGLPLPPVKTSFAYDKFGAMLSGASIKMDKRDNLVTLGPLTDQDVKSVSAGPVKNPLFVRAKDLRPERGGLFDPVTTGGTTGRKWAHIDLEEPLVNPTFERPARTLLGMTQKEFKNTMRAEGGRGIRKRLREIDTRKRERSILANLKKIKGTVRDNAIKELKYIRSLRKAELTPDKAYVISKVPVVPPQYRPIVPGKTGDLQVSDANWLYRDVMLANDLLRKSKSLPPEVQAEARQHLYDATGALYGLREPVSPQVQQRGVRGFIARIAGKQPKTGFFHSKLVRKTQDVSARGTIVPDTTMGIDEIGVPEEMAWESYSPFIIKRLITKRGYKALDARQMVKDRHPTAHQAMTEELRERPIIVNRAPSLRRYNVLAAYPRPVPGKSIRIHELLAPVMAGDFDGDAVQMHVPISDAAVGEAKGLTLSNMLLGDQWREQLLVAPDQEAVLGLYQASIAKASGKKKTFKSKKDAIAAYHRGDITLGTPVEIKK